MLCSSHERSLLPRGEVVPATDLVLPADALAQIGRGAPDLNAALVLCRNVGRRHAAAAVDRLFVAVAGAILGTILVLPLTVIALLVWRRQAVRRQQLRVRLGLPEPAATPAGVSPPRMETTVPPRPITLSLGGGHSFELADETVLEAFFHGVLPPGTRGLGHALPTLTGLLGAAAIAVAVWAGWEGR